MIAACISSFVIAKGILMPQDNGAARFPTDCSKLATHKKARLSELHRCGLPIANLQSRAGLKRPDLQIAPPLRPNEGNPQWRPEGCSKASLWYEEISSTSALGPIYKQHIDPSTRNERIIRIYEQSLQSTSLCAF